MVIRFIWFEGKVLSVKWEGIELVILFDSDQSGLV